MRGPLDAAELRRDGRVAAVVPRCPGQRGHVRVGSVSAGTGAISASFYPGVRCVPGAVQCRVRKRQRALCRHSCLRRKASGALCQSRYALQRILFPHSFVARAGHRGVRSCESWLFRPCVDHSLALASGQVSRFLLHRVHAFFFRRLGGRTILCWQQHSPYLAYWCVGTV